MIRRGLVFRNIYTNIQHTKILSVDLRVFLCRFKNLSATLKSRIVRDADDTVLPSASVNVMGKKYKQDLSCEESRLSDLKVKALSFLSMVDVTTLDEQQRAIHNAHVQALKNGEMFYKDPATGFSVMTRLAHLIRGECCGNACRHCPFGQAACSLELRRNFNSAFYD